MEFQDVVFLPSQAIFHITSLKNCGRGESLVTTTRPRNVVGVKQVHAPCELLLFQQSLFCVRQISWRS